ncbi:MAG: double-strand break repair helicase AddA [Pseudomonadota bacterium]
MSLQDDATAAQVTAARPDASTWLAANAGSGKTRVLTDRVARLLLNGVEPQHILCLTYTKAAASEMQNRLFKRLGQWAMLEEDALKAALVELGAGSEFDAAKLRDARTLFARAIETPGGLKIQTIHSFCASLLRRFPLEARVSPQFTEIEDRAAALLRAEIVDQMAEGAEAAAVADLARHYAGDDFNALTGEIVRHREGFATPLDRGTALHLFGQPPDLTLNDIAKSVFLGGENDILSRLEPVLRGSGSTDQKLAERLSRIQGFDATDLPELENCFLYATGQNAFLAKTGGTSRPAPTKSARKQLAEVEPELDAFMQRVEAARQPRLALLAAEKTAALHQFAARFLPLYEAAKTLRGWLDFDDLIDRARALLSDEKVAAWVLFRIDGGIDHILVDEAQDTSPAQWDVIRKLAAEFTSGQGAREENRTIFVVGDKKQSIYSFQGADPREFDRMQAEFAEKLTAAERAFQAHTLRFSFRSAAAVLDVVDRTFEGREDAGFLAAEGARHIAFKDALPGRVDLWPLVAPEPEPEETPWYTPLDIPSPEHHTVVLANRVAAQIKWMIDSGQTVPDEDADGRLIRRPVQAGDFLILVQRRGTLFSEIIRACKTADLEIAGADRLKVGGELAVRDLAALLSFLAVPEDSLSLASALKSPLFGWSEQALFDLAHRRTEPYLWEALRARAEEFPETMAVLRDLRNNVDFLRPYDLIERILTRHKGRKHLLARLGVEAEDGINALLSQALAYERTAIPSLTGFLVWMETDDLEIKRQIDSASNQIRVMTVHGAKGLEAPIVILPDCGKRDLRVMDDILTVAGKPVWKIPTDDMPTPMAEAFQARKTADLEERLRLLYVAMTRAEKWLIVAAAGDLPKDASSWYQMVESAMDAEGARLTDVNHLAVKRRDCGDWNSLPLRAPEAPSDPSALLEPYFAERITSTPETQTSVQPSDLGGAKALPGEAGRDEEAAKAYGTLVHRYLEHMAAVPQSAWSNMAAMLADAADSAQAFEEAKAILSSPNLRSLFGPNTLSEIAVSAPLGPARLHGVIDRLIVERDRVLAVDFKTNQTVPDKADHCPEGLLRQMGAYAHALAQIYPDRRIETAILWTKTASLMHLPHDIVMAALQNTLYLDDYAAGS